MQPTQISRIKVGIVALMLTLLAPLAVADTKIAVFDWQAALMGAEQVKKEFKDIDDSLADDEARVRQLAEEGRSKQERLKQDGAIMSEDDKRNLQQEIRDQSQEYQFLVNKLQKSRQERRQRIVEQYRPQLEAAVQAVLKSEDIDLLLDRQAVTFAKPDLDITQQVADQLNKTE
ncbi:hypothetical protein BFW38_12590 [Terasakiispira papahanaumokuakeensis]|uniref:Molecular chaperone Skp n=1 Tax=Terasakiispira papahanaumokuakeensis TaxID=197479 RepID=A0A1E2VBE2_9GAMM|nr:OmpH family outer membrane protein [Terasakiispira papahanaumokuakeensis]ODC04243.1 hypothetical protein BFW38_12590 [Terasakiispira papahanaumokuakeensis]